MPTCVCLFLSLPIAQINLIVYIFEWEWVLPAGTPAHLLQMVSKMM